MTIAAFLRTLADRDIRITCKDDRLQLNAAPGVLTDELRAEIAARKTEILAFFRDAQGGSATEFALRHVPDDVPIPLSFAQQRLWFLHQLHPEDTGYNLAIAVYLPEVVDETLLQQSLEVLAQRHDILRTVFREVDGVPSQVVTEIVPRLRVIDLQDVPADRRDAEAKWLRDAEARSPFRLAEAPAVRATIIRIDAQRALFVVVIHHILADGWSLGLLVKQLSDIYDQLRTNGKPALDLMPWQYADYAYSEQRWFTESDQQADVDYWKMKLSGALPSLDLPTDRPRGPTRSSRGAVFPFTIPTELADQLRTLSRASGVTLFTTLLAVFKTLLYRYSGQSDILVGTPFANRKRVELESLIGLFVTTLVLRTDLGGDPSFRELLARVHDSVLDASEHQDYPFEKLVDLVRPDRSLVQSPLFQTAFILQNTPTQPRV
jgi:hypothetical protein